MVFGDARKLWEAITAAYPPGSTLTFQQIERVAPAASLTPSRRTLSRSHLRQLIKEGLIKPTEGPMALARYTLAGE